MRCNNHATDLSSMIGVCASCLRERLFTIIIHQQSNSNPYPTVNRPVSPYITHRNSINNQRFYNSPHIAITTGGCIGGSSNSNKKPTFIRFPSVSNLFRSNSRNRNGDTDTNHRVSISGSKKPSSVTPCTARVRKQRSVSDRGMSPVRTSDDGELTESCKQTPVVRQGGGQKSVTEMIFCPLVSASPQRRLNVKGRQPADCGYSGDVRAPVVPHISYAKSFSGNRSRKLVDFGRSDPNR